MKSITFEQLPEMVGNLALQLERIESLLLNKQAEEVKPPTEHFFTVQEAAKYLQLTVPTIYSKVSRGELPHMKRGKRLYFSEEELKNYLKGGKRKTNVEIAEEAKAYIRKG